VSRAPIERTRAVATWVLMSARVTSETGWLI
jgi:hypothetical protein